jgi:hypothetical protein
MATPAKPTGSSSTAATKKPAAKKSTARKPAAKKSTAKKPAAKKAAAKKPSAKKSAAKKPARKPAKSTSSARARAAGNAARRWSAQEIAYLKETVANSATAKEAFEVVGAKLGKSAGTVQQKWYAMQRSTGKGRRKAKRSVQKATNTAQATAAKAQAVASKQWTNLRNVDQQDLFALYESARTEIDRRKREFDTFYKRNRS